MLRQVQRRQTFVVLAAATAATLVLAACGSGASDTALNETGWIPGPLDEFQSRIFGFAGERTNEEIERDSWEQIRRQQQFTVECMAEQGFDFIPSDPHVTFSHNMEGPETELEFAQLYGFGIARRPESWIQRAEDMEPWVDPNGPMLAEMSLAEQDAWWYALMGPPWDGREWSVETSGCSGWAMNEASPLVETDQWASLREEMDRIWDVIQLEPAFAELSAEWASCMADAGHGGFTRPASLNSDLRDEWELIDGGEARNELLMNWNWEEFPNGPDLPVASPQVVAAFQERERTLAVARVRCEEAHPIAPTLTEVYHDLQAAFVERHRAELEAWAQYAEQRRAERGW